MSYADARGMINTGDLIAVKSRRGLLPWLTRLVTRAPWTHTAIAIWIENGLWAAEINAGGNHLVPVSQIGQPFDVYECPEEAIGVREVILAELRQKSHYAFFELIRIGIYRLTGLSIPDVDSGYVCNEFSARIYAQSGAVLPVPKIAAPDDLCRVLKFKLSYDRSDNYHNR